MQLFNLFRVLALATAVASKDQKRRLRENFKTGPSNYGQTNRYIVEFEGEPPLADITRQLASRPDQNGTTYHAFNCEDIFHGISIETSIDNADTIGAMPGVANVWQSKNVPVAKPVTPVLKTSIGRVHNYSMHQWTGVSKLHAEGIRGKGATVAIIDTGIDYTHKALGGCFGPGCKVAGGYDLVGANWDAHAQKKHPKIIDGDPMDFYGHGTHVAGIIAAENSWLTGVAPDANLLIYKVFADNPVDTDEETLIQAFCDAYSSGADVISASVGRPDGFSDNPWALVASRIVDRGIVVTISAGNEGYDGPIYSSSGANGKGVLSVAAVNVTGNPSISTRDPNNAPVPAYYTTWGPTNELLLKPDIGAPGYNVISTVPGQNYEEMSGTSMAAPYIAGIAALYIGKHGGRNMHGIDFAKQLGQRIASSGKSLDWASTAIFRNQTAPPYQVGTGLVDAYKVLHYDTQLTYEPFALRDSELFEPHWNASVSNYGDKAVKYTFSLEPAAGIELLDPYYGIKTLFDLKPSRIVPKVHLPEDITVSPGETVSVNFHFEPPIVDDDYSPMYSGKVWIKGDNGEKLSIPYGGAAYDTEKAFDTMFSSEPLISDRDDNYAWTFNVEKDMFDYIDLSMRLSYPCTNLRWDIYDSYWQETFWEYPPKVDGNGYIGSATSLRDADLQWFFDPKTMDKNDTISFPLLRVPRGYNNFWWFGKLANGTQIAPGNYTMRFAALRPHGNPHISDHWDIMIPKYPQFQVLPYNSASNSSSNGTSPGRIFRFRE